MLEYDEMCDHALIYHTQDELTAAQQHIVLRPYYCVQLGRLSLPPHNSSPVDRDEGRVGPEATALPAAATRLRSALPGKRAGRD